MSYAATTFLSPKPLIQLNTASPRFRAKTTTISAHLENSSSDPQLNLSVLRFTLGIPGLDESYLPRLIGYGFGSLLVLNHFAGSASATLPQLRTDPLGVSLPAFSIALPYLGKFLKGATPMDQTSIPEGSEQIFLISETTSNTLKEDLAWATYIFLRNTNTISVILDSGRCYRRELGHFSYNQCYRFRKVMVKMKKTQGFVLLASSMRYAYSDTDRAWARSLAKKFQRK